MPPYSRYYGSLSHSKTHAPAPDVEGNGVAVGVIERVRLRRVPEEEGDVPVL